MYDGPYRKQIRLQNYAYTENAYYFVTICSKDKEEIFSEIVGKQLPYIV